MIRATILHSNSGMAVGFTVTNHGDPKVCAAVTALVINTIDCIHKLCAVPEDDVSCEIHDGSVVFALKRASQRTPQVGLMLDSLVIALSNLSRQFPKDVLFDSRAISSFNSSNRK